MRRIADIALIFLCLLGLSSCQNQKSKKADVQVSYQVEEKGFRYIDNIEAVILKLDLSEREANAIQARLRQVYDKYYSDNLTRACVRNASLRYKEAILEELGCIQFYLDTYAYEDKVNQVEKDLIAIYETIVNEIDRTLSFCQEKLEEAYINEGNGVHANLRRKNFMANAVSLKAESACKKFNSDFFANAVITVMQEASFSSSVLYLNRHWSEEMDNPTCYRKFVTYFKTLAGRGTLKAQRAIAKTQAAFPDECAEQVQ